MPVVLPLVDLGVLLVLIGALIFIYLCTYIVRALFGLAGGVLGKLPVVGGWINSSLHTVEHKIVSVMATAAQGVDDAVGFSLHESARLIDWTYAAINRHSNLLTRLEQSIPGIGLIAGLHGQIMALYRLLHGTNAAQIAQLRHLLHLEERLRHGIGEDVLPRIRGLEREIDHTIARDLRGIRARERELEHGAANTWKWIRTHPLSLATTAFAGAVAIALQRLGGSWIRCRNWNRIGKHVCGLPLGLIEDLLATAIIPLIATDLCAFAAAAETVAHELTPVLLELVDVENALVGCHGATTPPLLTVRAPGAPPVRNPLPLAA